MKKIFLLVSLLLSSFLICAEQIMDVPGVRSDFNFTLIPYSGGVGVNLGSMYYGPHLKDVDWQDWKGSGTTDWFKIIKVDNKVDNTNVYYSSNYSDAHIVALGGAYNIPLYGRGTFNSNIPTIPESAYIEPSGITLEVNAFCDTNFEFVSQSNPIYRRPFQIEILPRVKTYGSLTDSENPDKPYNSPYTNTVYTLDSNNTRIEIKVTEDGNGTVNFGHKYLTMIAADMVLVLPFDYSKADGGYFSGGLSFSDADGLTYKNATYTLANLNDYTAVVTLQLTLTIEYKDSVNSTGINTYTDTRSLTIPFSGYYSSIGDGSKKNDSISLYVQATENAANLNLERQGEWITVGSIQFLYNTTTDGTSNSDIVKLFLSSSPFPDVKGSEFRMVHESATDILTNMNSLGFDARIVGTGSNSGDISINTPNVNEVVFNGEDYTGSIHDAVKTTCNKGKLSNNWGAFRHFHTFEGDIDIRFDSSGMMDAGIYRGYIYVHAVTEDEK